jgi:putative YphP/YqiW family bacilliredoxin
VGGDDDPTAHLRSKYLSDYPVSSPSLAIFQDGKPVFHMHRHEIEGHSAPEIAFNLKQAFDKFCAVAK